MSPQPPSQAFGPVVNRLGDVMAHTTRYAFCGVTRLSRDALVHPSSVSRLLRGKTHPSFVLVARLAAALEQQLGFRIDPRDLVAEWGNFVTESVCEMCDCRGCLPDRATDEFGHRTAQFIDVEPGRWVTSKYPNGYRLAQKGVPHA